MFSGRTRTAASPYVFDHVFGSDSPGGAAATLAPMLVDALCGADVGSSTGGEHGAVLLVARPRSAPGDSLFVAPLVPSLASTCLGHVMSMEDRQRAWVKERALENASFPAHESVPADDHTRLELSVSSCTIMVDTDDHVVDLVS